MVFYGAAASRLKTIGVKLHHSLLEMLNVKLVYMPSCILQKSTWSTYFVKWLLWKNALWPAQEVVFVLQRSNIPLVLTTKVTHLRSLLFR